MRFAADLGAALQTASNNTTKKTQRAKASLFGFWTQFCDQHGLAPSLGNVTDPSKDLRGTLHRDTRESRLCILLVFGLRYRLRGRKGRRVRADTVSEALGYVAEGITDLGEPDPRRIPLSGTIDPILTAFLKSLRDEDDPSKRVYPANVCHLEAMLECLDFRDPSTGPVNRHAVDLCIVAFFFLLRPGEYCAGTGKPDEGRSSPFLLEHVQIHHGTKVLHAPSAPLNDLKRLERITFVSLIFNDQKNAVKGERVGHKANTHDTLCPAKAVGRIVLRLRQQRATPQTPLMRIRVTAGSRVTHKDVTSTIITKCLRKAADHLYPTTHVSSSLLSARSLRPGGATALLCAGFSKEHIQLLGRWRSDAMFRYLHLQSNAHDFSALMLKAGKFTFTPQNFEAGGLPDQAPPAMAAILEHGEMYED